jgi:hypothetical protein
VIRDPQLANLPTTVSGLSGDLSSLTSRVSAIETNGYRFMSRSRYTSTTTGVVVPTGANAAMFIAVGGGGGGGGAATTSAGQVRPGNGGLSGNVHVEFHTSNVVAGQTWNVIVGAGGTGFVGSSGNYGGASHVFRVSPSVTFIYAQGGPGGSSNNANVPAVWLSFNDQSFLGFGPTFSSSGYRMARIPPSNAITLAATVAVSGSGGSNAFGHGAVGVVSTGNGFAPSGDPEGYGGGGSGGLNLQSQATQRAGGSGSSGLVIIDWYTK